MENYSLPSPSQLNYGYNPDLVKVLKEIEDNLKSKTPNYILSLHPLIYQFVKDDVNNIIQQFGWMIKSKWVGSREGGTTFWEICPL